MKMKAVKSLLVNQKKACISIDQRGLTLFGECCMRWHSDAFSSCSVSPRQCDIATLANAIGMASVAPTVAFEANSLTVNGVRLPLNDVEHALPQPEVPEDDLYFVEAAAFKAAKFCTKDEGDNIPLAHLYLTEGMVVGCDGHRFSKYKSAYAGPKGMLPHRVATLVERLARLSKISRVQVAFPSQYTWFIRVGDLDLQGQLDVRKYVDIERIFEKLGDVESLGFDLNYKAWATAAQAHKAAPMVLLYLSHEGDSVVFSSDICQVVVPYSGGPFPDMRINTKYLIEALKLKPTMAYGVDTYTPVLFSIEKGIHGVMPLEKV